MRIDLHTHTTASDGKSTPTENVQLAKERGLAAIAITDHDTVSGVEEALQEGVKLGIEVVPGIEVSTAENGVDVHVLGYYIDYQNPEFIEELSKLRSVRNLRNEMMIDKLQGLGIDISIEEVKAKQTKPGGNVGRPHIAEVLMDKGIVESVAEAFEHFLGKEGKAYTNPPRISPEEGLQLILKFGGIPVLAHPGLYNHDILIERLVGKGLIGIEVYHPDHSEEDIKRYERYAAQYDLLKTGGSDYHGKRNGKVFHGELGSQPVDVSHLVQLKQLKK